MLRALLIGAGGQDGALLARLLLDEGYEVAGITRREPSVYAENLGELIDQVTFLDADLLDQGSLERALRSARPTEVYNLAAPSFVPLSWDYPVRTAEFAAVGATSLLEAVRVTDPSIRVYQASSSEIFGEPAESPQTEDDAASAADAVRRREGVRPLHRRELPQALRDVRRRAGSSTTTSPRSARWSSSRGRSPPLPPPSRSATTSEVVVGDLARAATGDLPATTFARCG